MEGKDASIVLGGVEGELEGVAGGAMFEFFHRTTSVSFGVCECCGAGMERLFIS